MAAAAAVVEDVAASCRTAADAAADSSASSSRSDDPSSAAASWGPFRAAFVPSVAAAHIPLAVVLEAAFAASRLDPSYSGRCRTWAGCPCPGNRVVCCSCAAASAGFASCLAVLVQAARSSSVRFRLALACFDSSPSRAVVAAVVAETALVDFDCVYSCFDVLLWFELAAEAAVDLAGLAAAAAAAGMDRCCSSSSFEAAGLAVDPVAA